MTDSSLTHAYFDYLETWPGLRTWVYDDEIKVYRTPEILGILLYNIHIQVHLNKMLRGRPLMIWAEPEENSEMNLFFL